MNLGMVIPTYNEVPNVPRILQSLQEHVPGAVVLFVDDDSPDGTADLIRQTRSNFPNLEVDVLVRRDCPRGLGNAYRDGFEAMRRREGIDIIVQMDADGQHPGAALPALCAAVTDGADLAIGSRYVSAGGSEDRPFMREAISQIAGRSARLLLRLPYRDLTSGFKAWSAPLLRQMPLEWTKASGYVFQVEMTMLAHRMGARIVEVPYTFALREEGTSKMSTGIAVEAAVRMFRLALRRSPAPRFVPDHEKTDAAQ